jgi:hypothetical protein
MPGNIDPDFLQHGNGPWVNERCFGPRGNGCHPVSQEMICNTLCHLGAAGVGGTEEQNLLFHGNLSFWISA